MSSNGRDGRYVGFLPGWSVSAHPPSRLGGSRSLPCTRPFGPACGTQHSRADRRPCARAKPPAARALRSHAANSAAWPPTVLTGRSRPRARAKPAAARALRSHAAHSAAWPPTVLTGRVAPCIHACVFRARPVSRVRPPPCAPLRGAAGVRSPVGEPSQSPPARALEGALVPGPLRPTTPDIGAVGVPISPGVGKEPDVPASYLRGRSPGKRTRKEGTNHIKHNDI